ncbi:MAG: chemotaxis-specific protein-glutamate methyltransferase CheB [Thermoleophilaceae bacterium]|nr:chemotaxis-specific protein-glutamate methyltransferase CheB [Thermoleophilaceae bacterium]
MADDSAFMRRLISDVLTRDGMHVVAEATNGREAIDACKRYEPDFLSLDLAMPEVDGMEVLRKLRPMRDLKIVVVSSFSEQGGVRAVDALAEGAFELVPKRSTGGKLQDFLDDLLSKAQAATCDRTPPASNGALLELPAKAPSAPRKTLSSVKSHPATKKLVMIASSTGGPRALTEVVRHFPGQLGQGLMIVQHMPAGFTRSLATRLDSDCPLTIGEAEAGEKLDAGHGWVAPGGFHTHIRRKRIELSEDPPVGGLRPCADITITSAVQNYGGEIVLAVLTGMGRDGCKGAKLVKEAGGTVIAEHGDTTTVNGMPRAITEAGLADAVLPIDEIGAAIVEAAGE